MNNSVTLISMSCQSTIIPKLDIVMNKILLINIKIIINVDN